MPVLVISAAVLSFTFNKEATMAFLLNKKQMNDATTIVTSLNKEQIDNTKEHLLKTDSSSFIANNSDIETYMSSLDNTHYAYLIQSLPISDEIKFESGFSLFKHKIPMWIFIVISLGLVVWSYKENLSLIPLLGLSSCLYMMAELGLSNWIGFGIWLLVGLLIYFGYSRKNSKLNKPIR
jgi:hypothetical protein